MPEQGPNLLRLIPGGDMIVEKAWPRLGATGFIALCLILLPLVFGFEHRMINVALYVAIFALLSLGLNVVVGWTGLLELGYVTFLATGAVLTFNLLLWESSGGGHPLAGNSFGLLFIILASGAVCAVLGLLRGIPTLKLTGDYYAIVTLGLAEIGFLIFLNSEFTGGAFGMKLTSASRPTFLGEKIYYDSWQFYYLVMGCLGLTILLMDRLNRSRIGRAWAAIRLDEVAARASGIDISRNKMIAFGISGFFGGVGGALYAIWIGTVAVKALDVWQSILILCAVVLGGMGSIRGVLLGALILFPLREVLREEVFGYRVPPEASNLVYGLLLIFVMRFRPQGLLPRSAGHVRPLSDAEKAAVKDSLPALFVMREVPKAAGAEAAPAADPEDAKETEALPRPADAQTEAAGDPPAEGSEEESA